LFGLFATAGIIFLPFEGGRVIFFEELVSPKVAETIGQGWAEKYARPKERKIFAPHSRRKPTLAGLERPVTFAEK
jgi:hypothetical protein